MKKLIIAFLFISINLSAAQLDRRLQGTWYYFLYALSEEAMPTRCKGSNLLLLAKAGADRIICEDGTVLRIREIRVTQNDYVARRLEVFFYDRPELELDILHMKEADSYSAIYFVGGKFDKIYWFCVRR